MVAFLTPTGINRAWYPFSCPYGKLRFFFQSVFIYVQRSLRWVSEITDTELVSTKTLDERQKACERKGKRYCLVWLVCVSLKCKRGEGNKWHPRSFICLCVIQSHRAHRSLQMANTRLQVFPRGWSSCQIRLGLERISLIPLFYPYPALVSKESRTLYSQECNILWYSAIL